MKMEVSGADFTMRVVSPVTSDDWDTRVQELPRATVFHSQRWARLLHESYGHRPEYLVWTAGPDLIGLVPLVAVKSPLLRKRIVSVPFSDHGDILVRRGINRAEAAAFAFEHARESGASTLEFRTCFPIPNWKSSIEYYGHQIDLSSGTDNLFGQFASSVRRAIRKSSASGVRVSFLHGVHAAEQFYVLHCETRRKHGAPPQPKRFFRRLGELCLLPSRGFVALATVQGVPIAAAVFLMFHNHAVYKYAASNPACLHQRANNLILWEGIKQLVDQGLTCLDLGRTDCGNEGLRRFKLGWNSRESRLFYYRIDPVSGARMRVGNLSRGFSNRIMTELPIPMLRLIGEIAYRFMA